jgi:glycosyltransferase involved in cell wall biosynthesis
LVKLISIPERRAACGRAARARVESKFTEEAVAERYYEAYKRYAKRKSRKRVGVTTERHT